MRDDLSTIFGLAHSSAPTLPRSASPMLLVGVLAVLALAVGALIGAGMTLPVLAVLCFAASTWVAWHWPLISTLLALAAIGGHSLFQMTPGYDPSVLNVAGGVAFQDVVLAGLAGATALRIARAESRRKLGALLAPIIAVTLWLAIETLRNLPEVGVSTLGELRFRYLVLVLPLGLSIFLGTVDQVTAALRVFVGLSIVLPVAVAPVILHLNDWSFGPSHRIYPAHVSLGLLLGLIVLWRARSWIYWPRPLLYAATALAGLEIILDAHRSVWVAALAALASLWLVQFGLELTIRWVALAFSLVVVGVVLTALTPLDLWNVLSERSQAALAVQDTAMWRSAVWRASLQYFYDSPIAGRGLGLYWETYVPEFARVVTIFPHNLYVMVLVHLGLVGFLLFSWLGVTALLMLRQGPRSPVRSRPEGLRTAQLRMVGIAALTGSAAYGIAYGLEAYSLTLVGVALAGALAARHQSASVSKNPPLSPSIAPRARDSDAEPVERGRLSGDL